ncbi:SDR family NAD(P)-dependent oxidoreductase [Candidatus Neomarinimicrobiota bacterium]
MPVALITGCSSGFGMLIAARLARAGHTVYATMRNLDRDQVLREATNAVATNIIIEKLDVTDQASIKRVVKKIASETGQLDIVINNAGYGLGGFFEDLDHDEIRAVFETNFFGAQEVTRQSLPMLRQAAQNGGQPQIINISSIQGRWAVPGLGAYTASKFALEGFSEALYHELAPLGVRVVVVEPGSYSTEIFTTNKQIGRRALSDTSPYYPYIQAMLRRIDRMVKSPEQIGDPEEVARLVERIINTPHPKFRYMIGKSTRKRRILFALLPFTRAATILRRAAFGRRLTQKK